MILTRWRRVLLFVCVFRLKNSSFPSHLNQYIWNYSHFIYCMEEWKQTNNKCGSGQELCSTFRQFFFNLGRLPLFSCKLGCSSSKCHQNKYDLVPELELVCNYRNELFLIFRCAETLCVIFFFLSLVMSHIRCEQDYLNLNQTKPNTTNQTNCD